MHDITKKRILIIGSTGGLGSIIAEKFNEYGAKLFLQGHKNENLLSEFKDRLKNVQEVALADISKEEDVEGLYQSVAKCWKNQLDGMVLCSGINPTVAEVKDLSLDDWNRTIAVNLTGPFLCIKHGIPLLKKAKDGKIVIISSIFGIESPPNRGAYGASKHGLTALVQTVSKEEGIPPDVIHINAICPGPAWGKNVEHIFQQNAKTKGITVEEYSKSRFQEIPAGRFLFPEELAEVAAFLCSDASNYINGTLIKLTGGAIE